MKNDLRFKSKAVTLVLMLVLVLTLPWPAAAKKVLEFDLNFKSPALAGINEKGFYIYDWDTLEIYFFSRETLQSPFKFGSKGEGPAEFKEIYGVYICRDYVLVSSEGKIVYFSPEGKYLKEIRNDFATIRYITIGDNFVCQKYKGQDFDLVVVKILDKNLQVKNDEVETYQVTMPNNILASNNKKNLWMVNNYFDYAVDADKLYIANTQKGFYIGVYDSEGKKLYEINRDYKKLPITVKDKENYMKLWRDAVGKEHFEAALTKYNILYPEYYPAYDSFLVANGKIHVIIYPEKDKKHELLVLDRQGNLVNKSYVPYNEDYNNYYFIFNGSYYYIEENEQTEMWELHEIKLY